MYIFTNSRLLRSREYVDYMKKFFLTTSWDDGSVHDLKLADLLAKYNIPATFYIPIRNPERKVMSKSEIVKISKSFEVGGHSLNHRSLTEISVKEAEDEINEGKRRLEDVIGHGMSSFSYPYGRANQQVKQMVGIAGFKFARTTGLFGTSIGEKLLVPTTVHAYDHHPFLYLHDGLTKKLFWKLLPATFNFDWVKLAKASVDWCMVILTE